MIFLNEVKTELLPITFPTSTHKRIKSKLDQGLVVNSLRVGKELGKYKEGEKYETPWGHEVVITSVKRLSKLSDYQFVNMLSDERIKEIGKAKAIDHIKFMEVEADKGPILGDFDESFYNSIPGAKAMLVDKEIGTYHTLMRNGRKAGVVGFIKKENNPTPYFQIAVHPDFRRQGMVEDGARLLANKYKFKEIHATVFEKNSLSMAAHKKAGFKLLPKEELVFLQKKGLLNKGQKRFYRKF